MAKSILPFLLSGSGAAAAGVTGYMVFVEPEVNPVIEQQAAIVSEAAVETASLQPEPEPVVEPAIIEPVIPDPAKSKLASVASSKSSVPMFPESEDKKEPFAEAALPVGSTVSAGFRSSPKNVMGAAWAIWPNNANAAATAATRY